MQQEIFLGRQPILDGDERLVAYELLFRSSGAQNFAHFTDDTSATATVLSHAFMELGLETALGPYKGFVNLSADMLMSDAIELLPPDRFMLELLEHIEITPAITRRCRELKDKGYALALDDFVSFDARYAPLLEIAEVVKVDLPSLDEQALASVVSSLRRWPVTLLAEKVDNEAQVKRCRELGFELFQGYFFAKPAIISGRRLNPSELALVRLLGLILDDAESDAIEAVFKQEPALALNLIRLTNSAACGLSQRVTSLRHAITMLGRRQMQRWLQLLLYTNPASGKAAGPLLQLAATRGRLMELLAERMKRGREFADHAFMAGIMSLMPAALGVPLDQLLVSLNVAGEIRDALMARKGTLGRLLTLAEKLDDNDADGYMTLVSSLPHLGAESVNACLAQALAWATSIETNGAA